MGSTNKTQRLNLPQFVDNDKPSWRGDVNSAFAAIDAYATSTDATVTDAVTRVQGNESKVTGLTSRVSTAEGTIGQHTTALSGLTSGLASTNGVVTGLAGDVDALQSAQETDAQTAEDLASLTSAFTQFEGAQSATNTTIQKYIDAEKVARLEYYPGVDNTGSVECSSAIQAAIGDARTKGFMVIGRGTFKIGSTVRIDVDCDLSACTFNYNGADIAVRVGMSNGSFLMGRTINLPRVYNVGKVGLGWASGTVGVQLFNLYNSTVYAPQINEFESGLQLYGQGMGCAYNLITLGMFYNNKRNIRFSSDATGWVNENKFLNGRMAHNAAEGTKITGCRHIHMDAMAIPANNNTWIGTSLEGPDICDYNAFITGRKNYFAFCRWENTGGSTPRVYLDTSTGAGDKNVFMYGVYCDAIVFTSNSSPVPTYHRYSESGLTVQGDNFAGALLKFKNIAGDGSTAFSIYGVGDNIEDNGKWSVRASSNGLYFKGPNDTAALLAILSDSGQVNFGNSTGTGSVGMNGAGGPGMLAVTGINTGTSAAAGSAGALPAAPAGYMNLTINGTVRKIPYYA